MEFAVRVAIPLPQALADQHTLIAQRYAGYFVGHPYRAAQQRTGPGAIVVEKQKPWVEPAVVSDDCVFCQRLTDRDAERRVNGYQHAIDIEVLRSRAASFADWLASCAPDVVELEEVAIGETVVRRGVMNSARNRRAYIAARPHEFDTTALAMVDLPLRLKRKLCIEWNHLYRDWISEHPGAWYDFEAREFYREVDEPAPVQAEEVKSWWGVAGFGAAS
jgi:hypothetical protein